MSLNFYQTKGMVIYLSAPRRSSTEARHQVQDTRI